MAAIRNGTWVWTPDGIGIMYDLGRGAVHLIDENGETRMANGRTDERFYPEGAIERVEPSGARIPASRRAPTGD